jgi:hypothetical protein
MAKRYAFVIPSLSFHLFCLAAAKTALPGFPNRENDRINEYRPSINVFRFMKVLAADGHAALISGALQNIPLQCTMDRGLGHRKMPPMSEVWKTKYGPRRVRFDPPTLKEAIAAARGLTNELQQQAEIAASLMELPLEAVRAELLKTAPPRTRSSAQVVTNGREGNARTVIVERKRSRVRRP